VCQALLEEWLRHPFFRLKPPKSTGRELFGESFFKSALHQKRGAGLPEADVLATLTAFTARSLALNYRLHLPGSFDLVVLAGGGAANPVLRQMISKELLLLDPCVEVRTSAELGWPAQSVEPAAFALLAWLRMKRRAGNLPATTGASAAVLLGQVTELSR
jgi:anhydro-N-acetylmuramic acid kinase